MERGGAGAALVGVGAGGVLGAAVGALLAARPAAAAPENEKLDYLVEGQLLMVQQLQRLVEIGEQLTGQVPIVIEPKIVPNLVTVPLEPRVLNHAIQAMGLHGVSLFPTTRATWLCPAGATTDIITPMPEGFVATCTDYILSSDFYDPNMLVSVFVDDRLITPFGLALTGVTPMEYGEYYVKHKDIRVSTFNNTAVNAQLSLTTYICLLEKSFYERFYHPIIKYMFSALEGVAYGKV